MLAVGSGNDRARVHWQAFYGVDRAGREWRLDPYMWSPIFDSVLQTWVYMSYGDLSRQQKGEAARFLFAKANDARASLYAGKRIGFDRRLGILSCPYWWRLPRWRKASPEPYRALRFYRIEFTVGEIARDPTHVTRHLIAEIAACSRGSSGRGIAPGLLRRPHARCAPAGSSSAHLRFASLAPR